MRWKLALVALVTIGLALSLSGCLGGDANPVEKKADDVPADEKKEKPKPEKLYSFDGTVTGASPTQISEPGRLSDATPIAKTDTFKVQGNFSRLSVTVGAAGTGNGRMEIYNENGDLVFSTETNYYVGKPGGDPIGFSNTASAVDETKDPENGTYTVHYYVAGAFGFTVKVEGVPPKPPKDEED